MTEKIQRTTRRRPLTQAQRESLVANYLNGNMSPKQLSIVFNIVVSTVYKTLWREGVATGNNSKKRITESRCVDGVPCKTTQPILSPSFDANRRVRSDCTESPDTVMAWREHYPIQYLPNGNRTRRRRVEGGMEQPFPSVEPVVVLPYNQTLGFDYIDGPWVVDAPRLAEICGMPETTLKSRLNRGWTIEEALHPDGNKLRRRRRSIERYGLKFLYHQGQVKVVEDWAAELGLSARTMHKNLSAGWSVTDVLDPDGGKKRNTAQIRARNGKYLTYQGRTQLMGEWAEELGMMRITLRERLKHGWSVEKALGTPIQHKRHRDDPIKVGGRSLSSAEWSEETGIPRFTIMNRILSGWTEEQAVLIPAKNPTLPSDIRSHILVLVKAVGREAAREALGIGVNTISKVINDPKSVLRADTILRLWKVREWANGGQT